VIAIPRIDEFEPGGPGHLPEVGGVGDGDVAQAGGERQIGERDDHPLLGDDGGDAGGGGEHEERQFFQQQGGAEGEAAEGPVIEEEQEKGQGDDARLRHQAERVAEQHQQVIPPGRRPPDVAEIGRQGEHEEEAAQEILPLRHPGDRFGPQGMDGEEGGDEGTAPGGTGHGLEDEEEEDRDGGVEEEIGQVVAAGVEPIELAIGHMRNPGERMPVEGPAMGESPADPLEAQSPVHLGVPGDVGVVVEIDEIVAEGLRVDQEDGGGQGEADDPREKRPVLHAGQTGGAHPQRAKRKRSATARQPKP